MVSDANRCQQIFKIVLTAQRGMNYVFFAVAFFTPRKLQSMRPGSNKSSANITGGRLGASMISFLGAITLIAASGASLGASVPGDLLQLRRHFHQQRIVGAYEGPALIHREAVV